MRLLLLSLCLGLVASAPTGRGGRALPPPPPPPSPPPPALPVVVLTPAAGVGGGTQTTVTATQNGATSGAASIVSGTSGSSAANSNSVTHGPGFTVQDQAASNAAVNLQAAGAGNSAFTQTNGIITGSQAALDAVGAAGASNSQAQALNAAVTSASAGGASVLQQTGSLTPISTNQGAISAGVSVGTQGAIQGIGSLFNEDTVTSTAHRLRPAPVLLSAGGVGVVGAPVFSGPVTGVVIIPTTAMPMTGGVGGKD